MSGTEKRVESFIKEYADKFEIQHEVNQHWLIVSSWKSYQWSYMRRNYPSISQLQQRFNKTAVEVIACISNFTLLNHVDIIIYPCPIPDAAFGNLCL